jgi:hypothetical protein
MSNTETNEVTGQDEEANLKKRADLMGITYHPSIGLVKLREKVNTALAAAATKEAAEIEEVKPESDNARRIRSRKEAHALRRVQITCMNPAKKEWSGELFTVGNSVVGTVTHFVPFNAEDGWHLPSIIVQAMEDRMCQVFAVTTDSRGNKGRSGKLIKEFAIQDLPALTELEISKLAARQAASKSIDR